MAQLKLGTTIDGQTAWHAGNDGPGSTLDADTVDGQHASAFATSGHSHTLDALSDVIITTPADNEVLAYNSGTSTWINQTAAEAGLSVVGHAHTTADITSGTFANVRISASSVQQHVTKTYIDGLNVDADTLDGVDSAGFATSSHNHDAAYVNRAGDIMSGILNFNNNNLSNAILATSTQGQGQVLIPGFLYNELSNWVPRGGSLTETPTNITVGGNLSYLYTPGLDGAAARTYTADLAGANVVLEYTGLNLPAYSDGTGARIYLVGRAGGVPNGVKIEVLDGSSIWQTIVNDTNSAWANQIYITPTITGPTLPHKGIRVTLTWDAAGPIFYLREIGYSHRNSPFGINSHPTVNLNHTIYGTWNYTNTPTVNSNVIWHAGNDGAGSGLDADTIDGLDSTAFATSGHSHDATYVNITGDDMTGALTINGDPVVINIATGADGIAIGSLASASTANSIAIGSGANSTTGTNATSLGFGASAFGADSTAIGASSTAGSGAFATALGASASASGLRAVAIGLALAGGERAVAIGDGSNASHLRSAAIGNGATTSAANQGVLGVVNAGNGPYNWFIPGNLNVGGTISHGGNEGYLYKQTVVFTTSSLASSGLGFKKADYPGLRAVKLRLVGGGGGGGGSAATGAGEASAGTGGSGAGYAEKFIVASALATAEDVVVGAAGVGVSGTDGTAGGDTSFGTHVTASGGAKGVASPATSSVAGISGPAGGTVTGGDISIQGGSGGNRFTNGSTFGTGGRGGDTPLGTGGQQTFYSGSGGPAGRSASGYGAGGSGAAASPNSTAQIGGSGAQGIVLVDIYV